MKTMNVIEVIRTHVRGVIDEIARILNRATKGRITPDMITWTGFLAHFVIGYYIVTGQLVYAAFLLVIFGLFDALDGSLARLQGVASSRGMFLDAVTDRFKEVILYVSMAWYLPAGSYGQILCVAACGVALSISYVKAKGESAIATSSLNNSHQAINHMFHDGLAAFEIRICIVAIGLLSGHIVAAVGVISVLGLITLYQRFVSVYKVL